MACGCVCVSKVFLILLNILTGIFGFILLAVGIFAQFAGEVVKQGLAASAKAFRDNGMADVDLVTMYNEIRPIVNGIAIPLIVIGFFFFIVSMFGCYGACCNKQVCLLIYAIMVTIVFVGLLIGVIYLIAGADQVKETSKSAVKEEIVENFVGANSTNGISLVMNVVHLYFKCCGMDNSEDFEKCKKWERDVKYTFGPVTVNGKLQIPITCCKMKGEFPSVEPEDETCPMTTMNSNKDTGCFGKLEEYVAEYVIYIYVGLAMPLVFLAILVGLGWFLWKKSGDSGLGSAAKMV